MDPVDVKVTEKISQKHLSRLWAEAVIDVVDFHPVMSEYSSRHCFLSARMEKLQGDINVLEKAAK